MNTPNKPIILFDGVCNLCNHSVQTIIKYDRKNLFTFASLQSNFGQQLLEKNNLNTQLLSSIILYQNNEIYTKSTAVLAIANQIGFPFSLAYSFIIVPTFIRDAAYNFIAKNRYKWFGKQETCWLPTQELRNKFLD